MEVPKFDENEQFIEMVDSLFFSSGRLNFWVVLYLYLVVLPVGVITLLINTIKYKVFKK